MKTSLSAIVAACSAIVFLPLSTLTAQEGQGPVKVELGKIEINEQMTPRYEFKGTKDKRDRQQTWLEIEVPFQAKMAGSDDYINELQFDYYVLFDAKDKQGRRAIYTATVNHINVPKDEATYSVVYISPISLGRIFGKGKMPKSTAVAVAVEVKSVGTLVGGDVTKGKSSKWWRNPQFPRNTGVVLNKSQTPFAPLWWDRYPEVKKER